jgi:hypothetical protein
MRHRGYRGSGSGSGTTNSPAMSSGFAIKTASASPYNVHELLGMLKLKERHSPALEQALRHAVNNFPVALETRPTPTANFWQETSYEHSKSPSPRLWPSVTPIRHNEDVVFMAGGVLIVVVVLIQGVMAVSVLVIIGVVLIVAVLIVIVVAIVVEVIVVVTDDDFVVDDVVDVVATVVVVLADEELTLFVWDHFELHVAVDDLAQELTGLSFQCSDPETVPETIPEI